MASERLPALFIPHGGGPCFFMEPKDAWLQMELFLRGVAMTLPERPRAVLVISGHWEAARPTLYASPQPVLLYDYYGFPEDTYRLTYPVPGNIDFATEVHELLSKSGIQADIDTSRGLDHGVFIPFKLIYPDADLPVLQLSLEQGLDPARHLALGRALAPLRDRGVLIVGSGMSYHNLREMGSPRGNGQARDFDDWLTKAATDAATREASLENWQEAPGARAAHPAAEHLLPLMVAAGAAHGEPGQRIYSDRVFGKAQSGFRFG